jgi:hypothetical protein
MFGVLAAFVGCQPDSPVDGGKTDVEHYVRIESDTLYLGSESSGETPFYVESHDNFWTFSYDESAEWCMISDIVDESGVHYFVIEAEPNTTGESREVVVTVTNGDAAAQFVIVQLADQSTPATTITLSQEMFRISREMTTIEVEVATDGDYSVVIPEECDWVSLDNTKVEGGTRVESLFVSSNFGEQIRRATITLKSLNAEAEFVIEQWGSIELRVDVSEKTLFFPAGQDTIRVESIADYTASVAEGEWVSINTELSTPEMVIFDYEENTADEERTAVITLSTKENQYSVVLTEIPSNLTEMPEKDDWKSDIAVNITTVEATSQMSSSRGATKAVDGNVKSSWYSATNSDKTQELKLNIDASNVERIDYLRYVPANGSMTWGRWGEVEIYATAADGTESLVHASDFGRGACNVDVLFEPALPNTTTCVRVVIKSAEPYVNKDEVNENVASAAEVGLFMYNPEGFVALDYFTDWSLSQLREDVTYAMISEIKDPFYRSLAEQIYLGTYNDEFRVCEFKAYPHPERDANLLRDTAFSSLDNATGMFIANVGDTQYIYLDEDYGLEIYVRVIDWVNDDAGCGNSATNHTYDYQIQKGRNVITPKHRGLMYIIAISDNYENIPPMKAHFVNAQENGYIKKGVTKAEDVARIFGLATNVEQPRLDMIGEKAMLNFNKTLIRKATFMNNPKTNGARALELLDVYDTIVRIQEHFTGLPKYSAMGLPRYHRHHVMFNEVETNNAGYSAYGHIGCRTGVEFWVNPTGIWPKHVTELNKSVVGSGWTLMHELGHATQTRLFKWCGLTEVTNNFMCDLTQNALYGEGKGYTDLRYGNHFDRAMKDMAVRWVWDFTDKGEWYERPWVYSESVNSPESGKEEGCVDYQTRIMPFYQLYLYYHLVKGNKDFYPDFYELCRTKDLYESNYNNAHEYNSAVIMEYVKTISEAAGEDLSHWADEWGIPGVNRAMGVNKGVKVNHYQEIFFKTTEEDVAALKEYCSKFPKPELDLYYLHDLNLELYHNPQPVTAGTHTVNDSGTFKMEGWQNVAAWLLVDPDKTDENGEQGRVVAVVQCDDVNGGGSFKYVHQESRYIPKDAAAGDYSDYWYNNGSSYASSKKGTERGMEATVADIEYTKSLQLYAVDVYGKRYASGSNTR